MRKRSKGIKRGQRLEARSLVLSMAALALLAFATFATAKSVHSTPPGNRTCFGKLATLIATAGKKLVGTPRPDVIVGSPGDDRIDGGGGNDLICAGTGADVVRAGAGDDRVYGEAGSDDLRGEAGADTVIGGGGVDRCNGGKGRNHLSGCEQTPAGKAAPNRPPTATDLSLSTDERSAASVDVSAAGKDPDGDALTFTALSTEANKGSAAIVDGGSRIRFDPAGEFAALGAGQNASESYPFTLGDGKGHSAGATLTVTVTGVDDPPSAKGDEATVAENAAATAVPVLGNDSDVDGGPKQVVSVTDPAHGTAAVAGAGAEVTYQPDPGYCNDGEAPDSFGYSLNGGSIATVEVRVTCVTTVSTDQGLFPEFSPEVSDYTVRCDDSPLEVSGRTAAGEEVAVDGQAPATGQYAASVPLQANQEFDFEVIDGGGAHTYYVRCLPPDFPAWEYQRFAQPHHSLYLVTPAAGAGAPAYAIVFDDHGVPLWWYGSNPGPIDAKFIDENGEPRITWWGQFGNADGYQLREFDGTVTHTVSAVGGSTDIHELQREPNGDYLVISYQPREHVDLTPYGGGADETIVDAVVEEISPTGQEVWSWSTQGHIGLDETGRWWPTALASSPHDIFHMNAVEPDGDNAILISLRHTDAIYKVDKTTGEILWKLGGTWTPKSLTIKNDPQGAYPLGGQHDVRLQPDGTVSVHDNDTNLPDPPRVVRYEIDEANKTATLVEQINDPKVPGSFCCGSARRSADGSWLISWGGDSLVTEFDADRLRTFQLGFGGIAFSYRAVAAPADIAPSVATLRAGMDAMHPRL